MGDLTGADGRVPLKVFISYRHEDTKGTAWALYWPLEARFGRANVFFDNGKLRAGEEWLDEIDTALDQADVLLILIGPSWWDEMSARFRRDGKDYVKYEIERGLGRQGLTVIPVLVDDTPMPDEDPMPPSLKKMVKSEAVHLRHSYLRDDAEALIASLSEIAQRAGRWMPEPEPAPPEPLHQPTQGSAAGNGAVDATPAKPVVPINPPPIARQPAVVGRPPDEDHYNALLTEARDSGVVVFLGAEVNAEDSQTLPNDEKLARYIAGKAEMVPESDDLAAAAQYARVVRGEGKVFEMLREGLAPEPDPGYVHRYLAGLPSRLKQAGLERRHPMIVTTKYDDTLERAFRDCDEPEPYDTVVYMGPGTDDAGKFVHVPWDQPPEVITDPRGYRGLPIQIDGRLDRTLIVHINGSVHDPDLNLEWKNNYVVTEDHYIEYLTGSTLASLVPVQIVDKLMSASCLFLGYTMADWRLRVFLKRLWPGERLGGNTHWAVCRTPTRLEERLCFTAGVDLYQSSLIDYVKGFNDFLTRQGFPQAVP